LKDELTVASRSAETYSWIPPEFSWTERGDIFALELDVTDQDLIEFIAEGALLINVYPSKEIGKVAALLLGESLKSQLSTLFSSDPGSLRYEKKLNEFINVRVFWHGAFILPGDKKLLVFAGASESANSLNSDHEHLLESARELFEKHKRVIAAFDAETEQKRKEKAALYAKYPDLEKYDWGFEEGRRMYQRPVVTPMPIVGAFPKAISFPLGRMTSFNRIRREAIRRVYNSGWLPSREGIYEGFSTNNADGKKIYVASWRPYEGLPSYPEVRWAVQRQLPSALQKPRLSEAFRPTNRAVEQPSVSTDWSGNTDWDDAFDNIQLDDTDYRERVSNVRESLSQNGFEAIAWYQAFHVWTEESWGIYFDAEKLDDLALTIFDECKQQRSYCQFDLCARLAFGLIYSHELFHARVEASLSWLELNVSRPSYLRYNSNVYKHLAGTDEWLEEALANWVSWQWSQSFFQKINSVPVNDTEKLEQVVEAILDVSPAGYNNWRTGHHKLSWQRLATQMVQGRAEIPKKRVLPLESLLSETLPYALRQSDVPLIFVGRGTIADRLQSLPSVINIPARKEIERALRYFKYALHAAGGKGSHEKWIGPDNRAFILPRRDPLSRGVFKAFLDHFNLDKMTYARQIRPNL
jgi:hypothetical protein